MAEDTGILAGAVEDGGENDRNEKGIGLSIVSHNGISGNANKGQYPRQQIDGVHTREESLVSVQKQLHVRILYIVSISAVLDGCL